MCGKTFFCYFFLLIINYYLLVCTGYWISDLKSEALSNATNESSGKIDEIDSFQQVSENKSTSTTENITLFWTMSDLNNTTETKVDLQIDTEEVDPVKNEDIFDTLGESINNTVSSVINQSESVEIDQTNENKSQVVFNNKAQAPDFTMYEKIVLQRTNCNLEIAVQETRDLKIEIRFQKLENNISGQCCITLNSQENNMLGILISNVHLYGNASQGEVLKVITTNYGINFVLKEYHSKNNYEPLLLTETHKAYIILYYNAPNASFCMQDTYFNLEVYSFRKYENYIHYENRYSGSYSSYNQSVNNFPATESSFFAPYFY